MAGNRQLAALVLLLVVVFAAFRTVQSHRAAPAIEGSVADSAGPVNNAVVRFKGTSTSTRSDEAGRFRLRRPAGPLPDITAWKHGYLIAGTPANRPQPLLKLQRLPAEDFEDYAWVEPGPEPAGTHNCINCHRDIYHEWSASGHARSVDNRRFRNLYDGTDWKGRPNAGWSLLAQNPDASGVCTACHAPTVAFGDPAYYDLRQTRGVAARGVHCDYCHKVVDAAVGPPRRGGPVRLGVPWAAPDPLEGKLGETHGRFGLKLLRPAEGQLFFGPLDDVDRGEDSFFAVYRESRYCASCHEGTVLGVHVYSTYSEWLASPARRQGKQCQTCHMAPTGAMTNIAPGKGGSERDPWTLASHRFQGGQADMLRRSLKLDVEVVPQGDSVRATLSLRAVDVGHRVPTGFIDRNLILVVEPLDATGKRLPAEGGPRLPEVVGKALAGLPGRLYAKLLTDETGKHPAPFWKAPLEPKDTRLLPDHPDRSEYVFPQETAQVRVRLLYRRFWRQVTDSKGWPDDEIVVIELHRFR